MYKETNDMDTVSSEKSLHLEQAIILKHLIVKKQTSVQILFYGWLQYDAVGSLGSFYIFLITYTNTSLVQDVPNKTSCTCGT